MSAVRIPELGASPAFGFPAVDTALAEPDGLLALGGDLAPSRLLEAYRRGIFPWYSRGEPILWWCPSRRAVFRSDGVRLSSRLRRQLRGSDWQIRADGDFPAVIAACARAPRRGQSGTWITPAMQAAYIALHRLGHAHCVEVRDAVGALVGGLYGVAVGRMFCGESMFSAMPGASSAALGALALRLRDWGWPLIDAQVLNPHTARLGAEDWARADYLAALSRLASMPEAIGPWDRRFGELGARQLAD